jgi:Dyp-type peroxidase family
VGGPALAVTTPPILETEDMQGILARGYSGLRQAHYVMLRIQDPAAACSWPQSVPVTPASERRSTAVVNLGFTAAGLSALGIDAEVLGQFAPEFVVGMTDPTRSRLLGDVGPNTPTGWQWGSPSTPAIHMLAMLFGADDGSLSSAQAAFTSGLAAGGIEEVIELETSDNGDHEPFGFHDSISQPVIEGLSKSGPASNTVRAGEFVLGYPNEYTLYTDRPILAATAPNAELLPRDPAGSGGADLGRNGTYLVIRQLRQDVFGFWRYLDSVTRNPDGTPNPAAQIHLGARMVGRWPSGAPLVLTPEHDDPSLADVADFGYHALDADGLRCPIGAHVRRSNPRDSLDPDPGSQGSIDVGKRHRLLRRGREFGPPVSPEQLAGRIDDGVARGLQFVCLCANISRQFEFIQHTWIGNPKFSGMYEDPDPLVAGRRPGANSFTVPGRPVRTRLTDLPQFVTVEGGAYFFLPGLRAIRYLAGLRA